MNSLLAWGDEPDAFGGGQQSQPKRTAWKPQANLDEDDGGIAFPSRAKNNSNAGGNQDASWRPRTARTPVDDDNEFIAFPSRMQQQRQPEPDADDIIEFPSRMPNNAAKKKSSWLNDDAQDGDDDGIPFPSRMQNKQGGGWGGSASQKNLGGRGGGAQWGDDADEDAIPFPSRVNQKQGGFNRPGTSQVNRQEEDIMWGSSNNNQTNTKAMKTLQSHLQGSSMQEMMGNDFQGTFSGDSKHRHKTNQPGPGGVKADPKFAQAQNKQQ